MSSTYKIVIAGDILPSTNNVLSYIQGDSVALFDGTIQQLFNKADFSIVNLEGPITNANKKQNKVGPVLKAPIDSVNGLKSLGVRCVALANNHFTDYLQQGCVDTLNVLDTANILHIGAGINKYCINKSISVILGEKKVCIYNVSETFFNLPSDISAGVNIYDEYLVCNDIKELKKNHDYLIIIYHGGSEMCPYPTPTTRRRFHRMADCGADFITAQHTHCIGCEERYNNSYLLYGQGNFCLDHMKNPVTKRGLVTQICFTANTIVIDHFIVKTLEGKVIVDKNQDFSAFQERSKEIQDESLAEEKYRDFIRNNEDLRNKYYRAYKGDFFGKKVLQRCSYRLLLHHIERQYGQTDLARIVFSLESDRMQEDVLCLWKQLQEKKDERSKP